MPSHRSKSIVVFAAGTTWTTYTTFGPMSWSAIICSVSGQVVYAVSQGPGSTTNGGYIVKSTDYGVTWTQLTTQPTGGALVWSHNGITTSWDGTVVSAIGYDPSNQIGHAYTSQDGGEAWKPILYIGNWISQYLSFGEKIKCILKHLSFRSRFSCDYSHWSACMCRCYMDCWQQSRHGQEQRWLDVLLHNLQQGRKYCCSNGVPRRHLYEL